MIVFLDIDGVLNQLQGNYHLDRKCIENLGVLCKKSRSMVVLTSSWRLGYSNVGKCSPQINELKELFRENNIAIIGRTFDLGDRQAEINDYIMRHSIDKYIILDDDISEFRDKNLDKLFIVNHKTGLTSEDVSNILKIVGE